MMTETVPLGDEILAGDHLPLLVPRQEQDGRVVDTFSISLLR